MLLPGLISWRGGKYCAEVDEGDLQQVFLWKYLMICKQLQHVDHQSSRRKDETQVIIYATSKSEFIVDAHDHGESR